MALLSWNRIDGEEVQDKKIAKELVLKLNSMLESKEFFPEVVVKEVNIFLDNLSKKEPKIAEYVYDGLKKHAGIHQIHHYKMSTQ